MVYLYSVYCLLKISNIHPTLEAGLLKFDYKYCKMATLTGALLLLTNYRYIPQAKFHQDVWGMLNSKQR